MRCFCAMAAMLLLTACAGRTAGTADLTQCADPRPQVCTMEYNPTCATLVAGGVKEYASPCNACADDKVAGYVSGSCPE